MGYEAGLFVWMSNGVRSAVCGCPVSIHWGVSYSIQSVYMSSRGYLFKSNCETPKSVTHEGIVQ